MARTGRPKKDIDPTVFEKLCGLQCTKKEIAGFFECSEDTIENFCKREYDCTFSAALNKYGSQGKISLRRTQFKLAEKNSSMAIWLGKQYLGQVDRFETRNIVDDDADALSKAFERLTNGDSDSDNE